MTIERLARFTTFFFVVRYMEFLSGGPSSAFEMQPSFRVTMKSL
jgi:hypothetical protein